MASRRRPDPRLTTLARLANEAFDVAIVGGGATGLGCAVDAATRGYSVALVEAADFAAGTSSRSTKLVHGGVRYLQEGDVHLVREALHERTLLLHNAPNIVRDLPFVTPAYRWYELPYYGTGLWLYDRLAGARNEFGHSRWLRPSAALERVPWLRRDGLRGGIEYHDGQFDDARLAIALVRTAIDYGAAVANYVRLVSFRAQSLSSRAQSRDDNILNVEDVETGQRFEIKAKVVVNAAGIFVDAIRKLDDPEATPMMSLSRGTHVVLERGALASPSALLVPKTEDGRVIFAIPWHDRMLIGTTDIPHDGARLDPQPTPAEVDYLLATVNRYAAEKIGADSIASSWAGLRPLVERSAVSTTAKLSREHVVETSRSGLVTIAGGKWTTYRKMAQDAVDAAIAAGNLTPARCVTPSVRLHDDNAAELAQLTAERPELAARLHPQFPYTLADVANAFECELARTPEDVIDRRTRLRFLDERAAGEVRSTVEGLR